MLVVTHCCRNDQLITPTGDVTKNLGSCIVAEIQCLILRIGVFLSVRWYCGVLVRLILFTDKWRVLYESRNFIVIVNLEYTEE